MRADKGKEKKEERIAFALMPIENSLINGSNFHYRNASGFMIETKGETKGEHN